MSVGKPGPVTAAPGTRLYLRPLPTTDGGGLPIAGGLLRFREVERAVRELAAGRIPAAPTERLLVVETPASPPAPRPTR